MLIGPQGPPWWIFFQNFFKNVLVYPQLTQKYVLWHSKLEKSILGSRELMCILHNFRTCHQRLVTSRKFSHSLLGTMWKLREISLWQLGCYLYEHVEGEEMLCLLQLPHQLLLLGLQLLQQHRALHLLPRLHEVRLLQDVQLQLLNTVNIFRSVRIYFSILSIPNMHNWTSESWF